MEMSKDCGSLKRYQTTDWFNKNRIVLKTPYRSVSDEIQEKCEQSNIPYYYGTHCIFGEEQWVVYKTEINETGLKVKELAKWALDKFN